MSKKAQRPAASTPLMNVLVIDDSPDYITALRMTAGRNRCRVTGATSLEEAQEFIRDQGVEALDGVVLDIVCLKTRDQQVESKSFLSVALNYFRDLCPGLPRVVVTGEPQVFGDFREIFEGEVVLNKGEAGSDDVFVHLRRQFDQLPRAKLIRQYPEVFRVFESGYLDYKVREELISVIKGMSRTGGHAIQGSMAAIRRVQESIYHAMSKANSRWIPLTARNGKRLFSERDCRPLTQRILHHLEDEGLHDGVIREFAFCTYHVASEVGAHPTELRPRPTCYTVKAALHMLLDLILWFGALMDDEREKQRGDRTSGRR